MSQRIIDIILIKMESQQTTPEAKEKLSNHYHHIINLHVMGFQTKGTLLEQFRRYDEAIDAYQCGKQVIEANYGHKHKTYVDLVNSINGAKLRTKYFLNSNLGASGQNSMMGSERKPLISN